MEYADASWRWLDEHMAGRDHIAHGGMSLACLVAFNFVKFGQSVGWSMPEGTDNLAAFVARHEQRDSASVWKEAE